MVTDEMLDAINILIEECENEEQAKGMESVREMLMDFDESEWMDMQSPSSDVTSCRDWLSRYLYY